MKFLVALLLVPATAWAYDSERVQTNLASDYALCAAYNMMAIHALADNSMDTSKAEAHARNALNMAVTMSNQEVTAARVELVTKMMLEDMQNDWSNYAVLINNYGPLCKQLAENPVQRLEYWRNKK